MRLSRVAACLSLLAFVGCALPPKDPFARAEWSLARDRLLPALRAFDAVPPEHARYREARAGAIELERRMRHCHELVGEALQLRADGRDEAALSRLLQAQAVWPGEPGVAAWIAATRRRIDRRLAVVAPHTGIVDRIGDDGATALSPSPLAESDVASVQAEAADPEPAVLPSEPCEGPADEVSVVDEPEVGAGARASASWNVVTAALQAVELRQRRGDHDGAVADLVGLVKRYPEDPRLRRRFGQLLHQRALLRYGKGELDGAIADWRRVLEFEPDNRAVAQLLRRVERERDNLRR